MKETLIQKSYGRFAALYDFIFGSVLQPGRKLLVEALDCQPGDRILEVGIGTGLSLPLYPRNVSVTGIDICKEMLVRAERRVTRGQLSQVDALLEMDAENMDFNDNSFDKVAAMYIVSVAANPARLIAEMRRVCRSGGSIVVVNHFHSRNRFEAGLEHLLAPFSKLASYRCDTSLDEFRRLAELDAVEVRRANLFGYATLLNWRNKKLEEGTDLATRINIDQRGHPAAAGVAPANETH